MCDFQQRIIDDATDVGATETGALLFGEAGDDLTSWAVINASNHPLTKTEAKTSKPPFHGRLAAKEARTARPDCTLPFQLNAGLGTTQHVKTGAAVANDLTERLAA